MVQSSSAAIDLLYGFQSAYGTPPVSMKRWRGVISDSLQPNPEYVDSDERTSDLQEPENSLGFISAGGSVELEESAGAHDDIKQSVLYSAGWSTEVTDTIGGAGTIDFAFTAGVNKMTLVDAGNNWDDVITGIGTGSWLQITNATDPANNGVFQVAAGHTGLVLTVSGVKQMVTEQVTGAVLTIKLMSQIVTGTTQSILTVERGYTDISNDYASVPDGVFTTFEKTYNSRGKMTASATFQGKNENSATSPIDATPDAAPTAKLYALTEHFKGLTTTINSSSKHLMVSANWKAGHQDFAFDDAGKEGPTAYGTARFGASGTIEVYYEGGADPLYAAFEARTRIPLAFYSDDGAGNGEVEEFPNCVLTGATRSKQGGDVGTKTIYTWKAHRHAAQGITSRIARFRAA